jgi:toxin ParE1/3/4
LHGLRRKTNILKAAEWYDTQRAGLGDEFIEEIVMIFDALEVTPLLHCRRHSTKNIRWRYPERFPYRVIYEVIEDQQLAVIAAVVHAARHDRACEAACELPIQISVARFAGSGFFGASSRGYARFARSPRALNCRLLRRLVEWPSGTKPRCIGVASGIKAQLALSNLI